MAEASNVDQSRVIAEEKIAGENGTAVCSAKGEIRVSKRPHEDSGEDAEPEEKRPSFRLNPPTLIHGQAKPAPKDDTSESNQKRNFLRPSILSAPATSTLVVSTASAPVNGKPVPSISQAPVLGTGLLLPGQVSSNNPFLRTAEQEEEKDSKQGYLFQATIEQNLKENGGDAAESNETAQVNGAKENVFLQMSENAATTSKDGDKKESGAFVFGSKMEERVVKNEADSTSSARPSQAGDAAEVKGGEFVFGKNLSDRVKDAGADSTSAALTKAPAESVIFHDKSAPSDAVSSSTSRNLEEDAAALFAASNTKPVMPEIEVVTGEEDEKNVLRIQCKLFQYDHSSKNWLERGRGNLRLNDKRISSADHKFQSRLVMRCHGSFRLILNTKIWATMMVDRASQKSVRISAQMENGDIGVYLIMATINDAEQIYRAVEYRVLHLKQIQEKEDSMKKTVSEEGVTSTESDQTKKEEYEDSSKLPDESESSLCEEASQTETDGTPVAKDEEKETGSTASTECATGDNNDKNPATEAQECSTNVSEVEASSKPDSTGTNSEDKDTVAN